MTKHGGRWLVVAVLVAGATGLLAWRLARNRSQAPESAPAPAMVASALRPLPADSYALATIPDLTGYARRFEHSAFGRMLADPALRSPAQALFSRPGGSDAASALGGVLESLAELGPLGVRSLALGVFPLPPGGASGAGFAAIVACDDPARVAAWLDQRLLASADQSGAAIPSRTPAADSAGVTCHDRLCRAARGNTFYLGSPRAALERVLPGATGTAGTQPQDARLLEAIARTGAETSGFFAWADLRRIVADLTRALASDGEAAKLAALVHLDALDSLALAEAADGVQFHDRVRLVWRPASAGLLGLLLELPPRELTLDSTLPADTTNVWMVNLPDLAAVWDRAVAALREGTPADRQDGIDQAIAGMNQELGFDLRHDLLGTFAAELGIAWSRLPEPLALPPEPLPLVSRLRLVAVVGVRDSLRAEKLVSALAERVRRSGLGVTVSALGSAKLWTAALGSDPLRHPSLALFEDRLVLASHGEDLRRLLARSGATLASDPGYRELRARLPGRADLVAWSRTTGTSFKDMLLTMAGTGESAGPQPPAAPPELSELGAAVDRHLASMPPSLALGRSAAGEIEYQALTPFNVGIAASLVLALAAPQLELAAEQRRTARSLDALRAVALACEAYRVDEGVPPVADSLEQLVGVLEPTWTSALPRADAWGFGLDYRGDGRGYVVASAGADGRFEQDWAQLCVADCTERGGETTSPDDDLVLVSGRLLRAPAGALAP